VAFVASGRLAKFPALVACSLWRVMEFRSTDERRATFAIGFVVNRVDAVETAKVPQRGKCIERLDRTRRGCQRRPFTEQNPTVL
jgi:hypothetical protein